MAECAFLYLAPSISAKSSLGIDHCRAVVVLTYPLEHAGFRLPADAPTGQTANCTRANCSVSLARR